MCTAIIVSILFLCISKEGTQQANKIGEQELEIKRLQKELATFHKEFQEIQNQEVTIRRLEEKIREYERRVE